MLKNAKKLISIGAPACDANVRLESISKFLKETGTELLEIYNSVNGLYAFESSLHIFPYDSRCGEIGVIEWNTSLPWGDIYEKVSDHIFFAEDAFGFQFTISKTGFHSFNPETGAFEFLADSIDQWASIMLNDFDFMLGYSLAHEWQKLNGVIPIGDRLSPKVPFVLGGEFSVENLSNMKSMDLIKMRFDLYTQIKAIPDGERVRIKFE